MLPTSPALGLGSALVYLPGVGTHRLLLRVMFFLDRKVVTWGLLSLRMSYTKVSFAEFEARQAARVSYN